MNRGARREPIFRNNDDALLFLQGLGTVLAEFRVEVHAYALMPNHYHLLVRSMDGRLSAAMKAFGSNFTRAINRVHKWDGPIFRGRFRNELLVDEEYFDVVVAYIHLNPVRANLVQRPDDECWTSYRQYLGLEQGYEWLHTDAVLGRFGDSHGLHGFIRELHQGVSQWPEDLDLDTGLLRAPILTAADGRARRGQTHARQLEPNEVLDAVCQLAGVSEERLQRSVHGRGANPARRMAAWALSVSTNLTHLEIGDRLAMSGSHVANVLLRLRRSPPPVIRGWMTWWEAEKLLPAEDQTAPIDNSRRLLDV